MYTSRLHVSLVLYVHLDYICHLVHTSHLHDRCLCMHVTSAMCVCVVVHRHLLNSVTWCTPPRTWYVAHWAGTVTHSCTILLLAQRDAHFQTKFSQSNFQFMQMKQANFYVKFLNYFAVFIYLLALLIYVVYKYNLIYK